MKTIKLFSMILAAALCVATAGYRVQAQQRGHETNKDHSVSRASEIGALNLLAQAWWPMRPVFSLMPESPTANASRTALSLMPMAAGPNVTVQGSGTLGRLTKWTGFTSSNSFIGDSTIFEDKFGKVGIGTDTPTSRLTVAGLVESTSGGVRFPDGTVQTTAGIAANQTVFVRDLDNPARQPVHSSAGCSANADQVCFVTAFNVPAGKRLVIEYISMDANIPPGQVAYFGVLTRASGVSEFHRSQMSAPAVAFGIGPTAGKTVIGQQVRIYADPGTNVDMSGSRNSVSGTGSFNFTISGHLVDLP